MRKYSILLVLGVAVATLLSGCTATDQGTATGALLGGATGAVIGNQSGHNAEGALIGGVVGAIAGNAIGKSNERAAQPGAPQVIVKCPNCKANIDVTGFPPGSQVRCPACNTVFTY
jgi:predicted Zn finger-like uncharacterized protein